MTRILSLRNPSSETPETAGVIRHSTSIAGTHRYEVQTDRETAILIIMAEHFPMDDELTEALYNYIDRQMRRNRERCG